MSSVTNPSSPSSVKLEDFTPDKARRTLLTLAGQLKGRSGYVHLGLDQDSRSSFKGICYSTFGRFFSFVNRKEMKESAQVLKSLFEKGWKDQVGEEDYEKFSKDLDSYIESRGKFGTESLQNFVVRATRLKPKEGALPNPTRLTENDSDGLAVKVGDEIGDKTISTALALRDHQKSLIEGWGHTDVKFLSGGAEGSVFSAVNERGENAIIKIQKEPEELDRGRLYDKRRGDVAASRLKADLSGICRPSELLLRVDGGRVWRVPADRMKEFFASQPKAKIEVMGSIMPKVAGEELQKLIDEAPCKPDAPHIKNVAKGLHRALGDLGKSRFVHRDIKPRNILYNQENGQTTLIDTGFLIKLSKETDKDHPHETTGASGTPGFLSPRCLDDRVPYGPETDYFSFAMTMLDMVAPGTAWPKDSPPGSDATFLLAKSTPETYLEDLVKLRDNVQLNTALENEEFRNLVQNAFLASSGDKNQREAGLQGLSKHHWLIE